MIFRLTAKTRGQLNISKLENVDDNNYKVFFKEWNVDVVIIKHKKYFMFTENKTLFTIIRNGAGIKSVYDFNIFVGKTFTEIFNDLVEGISLLNLDFSKSVFASTQNNNVRRAQIDHLYHAKRLVEQKKNAFDINRVPIASIGYKLPVVYFIEELGKILGKDGFVFVEDVLKK